MTFFKKGQLSFESLITFGILSLIMIVYISYFGIIKDDTLSGLKYMEHEKNCNDIKNIFQVLIPLKGDSEIVIEMPHKGTVIEQGIMIDDFFCSLPGIREDAYNKNIIDGSIKISKTPEGFFIENI